MQIEFWWECLGVSNLGRLRRSSEDIIKMVVREMGCEEASCMELD
jgi:hypothetical protein